MVNRSGNANNSSRQKLNVTDKHSREQRNIRDVEKQKKKIRNDFKRNEQFPLLAFSRKRTTKIVAAGNTNEKEHHEHISRSK